MKSFLSRTNQSNRIMITLVQKNLAFLVLGVLFIAHQYSFAQSKDFNVAVIGFYNFENLFDTLDTPDKDDVEFLPSGSYNYNSKIYWDKLGKLSDVVSEMGTDLSPDGPAILGLAEIETNLPLNDFVKQPKVASRNYQVVYHDGPDKRGVDVALLYNPKYFDLNYSKSINVNICGADTLKNFYSRDILYVNGLLDGELIHVMVNHWPSRRGGEASTDDLRKHAACVCKTIADSILTKDPKSKIFIMGDLNDDPNNESVKKIIGAKKDKDAVTSKGFFNPWWNFYSRGFGTTAYQDAWGLFDQILLSEGVLNKKYGGYFYYQPKIWNPDFIKTKTGQYKGYPMRTFEGTDYNGGYSDHFPVVVYLLKEKVK